MNGRKSQAGERPCFQQEEVGSLGKAARGSAGNEPIQWVLHAQICRELGMYLAGGADRFLQSHLSANVVVKS
jgi:hypothetical protein